MPAQGLFATQAHGRFFRYFFAHAVAC
ncbi:DUF4212 domain-containing protein, partial [Burkholderia pseudomallei]